MQTIISHKADLLSGLKDNVDKIKSYGVKQLSLFGSFANNHNINSDSDIDFLVEFEPGEKTYDNFMELSFFLEELTGRKIELVTREL